MMLWALRGVTLSRITINGKRLYHLTPLNAVQKAYPRTDGGAASDL